jgi:O-antigen ligase
MEASPPTTSVSTESANRGGRLITVVLCVYAASTALGPGPASIATAPLVVAIAVQAIRRRVRATDIPRDALVFIAVFAWKACTRALAGSKREALKVLRHGWWRLPYVLVGTITIDRRSLSRVLHALFAANAALVVVSIGQHVFGQKTASGQLFDSSSPARLQGFAGHPNSYAGCVALVLLLNLGIALGHERRWFAYTPFLAAGLLLSGSRGYVLAVAVGLVVLVALSPSNRRSPRAIAIGVLVVVVAVLATPGLSRRLTDSVIPDRSTYRVTFWQISWDLFRDHPIVGIGSGKLSEQLAPHEAAGEIDNNAQAHSLYLQELAEDGLPGLVLVVGTYVYFGVKHLRMNRRTRDPVLAAISLAALAGVVTLLVEGLVDFNFGNAIVAIVFSFVLGVVEGHSHAVVERGD